MTEKGMVITDLPSLHRWRVAARNAPLPSVAPAAKFALGSLDEGQNRWLTLEATRLHRACGCGPAGLMMTIAVLTIAASIAREGTSPFAIPVSLWGGYLFSVGAAAAAGKVSGLLWARRQVIQLAQSVEAMIGGVTATGAQRTNGMQ